MGLLSITGFDRRQKEKYRTLPNLSFKEKNGRMLKSAAYVGQKITSSSEQKCAFERSENGGERTQT